MVLLKSYRQPKGPCRPLTGSIGALSALKGADRATDKSNGVRNPKTGDRPRLVDRLPAELSPRADKREVPWLSLGPLVRAPSLLRSLGGRRPPYSWRAPAHQTSVWGTAAPQPPRRAPNRGVWGGGSCPRMRRGVWGAAAPQGAPSLLHQHSPVPVSVFVFTSHETLLIYRVWGHGCHKTMHKYMVWRHSWPAPCKFIGSRALVISRELVCREMGLFGFQTARGIDRQLTHTS
jgi:hypothetical protein